MIMNFIFIKESKAFIVDVTVRYQHSNSSLKDAVSEKAKKYWCLLKQIQDLTNPADVEFMGFPKGGQGK